MQCDVHKPWGVIIHPESVANLNIFDTFPTIQIYDNRLNVDMDVDMNVDIFLNNVKTYL